MCDADTPQPTPPPDVIDEVLARIDREDAQLRSLEAELAAVGLPLDAPASALVRHWKANAGCTDAINLATAILVARAFYDMVVGTKAQSGPQGLSCFEPILQALEGLPSYDFGTYTLVPTAALQAFIERMDDPETIDEIEAAGLAAEVLRAELRVSTPPVVQTEAEPFDMKRFAERHPEALRRVQGVVLALIAYHQAQRHFPLEHSQADKTRDALVAAVEGMLA